MLPSSETPVKSTDALVSFVDVAVTDSVVPCRIAPLVTPARVKPPSDVRMVCVTKPPAATLTRLAVTFGLEVDVAWKVAPTVSVTSAPDR